MLPSIIIVDARNHMHCHELDRRLLHLKIETSSRSGGESGDVSGPKFAWKAGGGEAAVDPMWETGRDLLPLGVSIGCSLSLGSRPVTHLPVLSMNTRLVICLAVIPFLFDLRSVL